MNNKMKAEKARRGTSQDEGKGKEPNTNTRPQQGGGFSLALFSPGVLASSGVTCHGISRWIALRVSSIYCIRLARCPLQQERNVSINFQCDLQKTKWRPHFPSSSLLRVRHHTHCGLAQYNVRIRTNNKAFRKPGKRLATPACTIHRHRSHTRRSEHILHGHGPHNFMNTQHRRRRSKISADFHRQSQWLRHELWTGRAR